ncbi:phospholipase-like protein, partial [Tanacetum coccineum]
LSKSQNYVPTYTLSGFVWSFKIWILESFEGSLIWWNRDPEIIPRGLAWSRKQLFKRSDYSLLFGKDSLVNLDLTPTISEQQTVWYMAFRKFFMSYIPRTPPTSYTDLFEDYIKKLSASRKRGKIDKRDLPIIRRCDTTIVEEIRLKDGVIAKLNSRFFKLEAIIKEYLIQEESRLKQEEVERSRLEEHKMMEALFLKTLQEEVQRRDEKQKMLKYDEDKKKRRHELMNSDHWKHSVSKITNGKRTQGSRYFTLFPWFKDVSVDRRFWESLVCLDPTKKSWIMDEHVELWVNYMLHVRPHDADWAMVGGYFVQLLLQDSIPSWYADGTMYKVSWCDVEEVFMPVNETDQHWCLAHLHIRTGLVTFYDSGRTYDPEWREWMIVSVPTPYSSRLLGFNMDEEPIIEVDDIGYQMDTTLQVYHRTQEQFQNLGVEANSGSFFVGAFKESLILSDETDRSFHPCVAKIPEVMMQARVFDQKGIDHTRYTISFTNAVNVPKQGGVFGDCDQKLEEKIKILEGALEMERHPENHTIDSAAILHELYNDMGKHSLE